jgi:hypothetical protein
MVDKRILYEITGRKGENEIYSDEEGDSSDEENLDKYNPNYFSGARSSTFRRLRTLSQGGNELLESGNEPRNEPRTDTQEESKTSKNPSYSLNKDDD